VPYHPRQPTVSWAASNKAWSAGQGGDPAPLLCSGETLPGVLHLDVNSSVQERHRAVTACPEEGHKKWPSL